MKLALDLDGVVFEHPEFFRELSSSLRRQGHEIILLTDSTGYYREFIEYKLLEIKLEYDNLVITAKKEEYCLDCNIEYAIDDLPEYYPSSENIPIYLCKIKKKIV